MNKLLLELERIKEVMQINEESSQESGQQMNVNLKNIVETLKYLKIYTKPIEKMLMEITVISKDKIIDFEMMDRGFRKILLKKGDKKKNIQEYLKNIITSLKFRERRVVLLIYEMKIISKEEWKELQVILN